MVGDLDQDQDVSALSLWAVGMLIALKSIEHSAWLYQREKKEGGHLVLTKLKMVP